MLDNSIICVIVLFSNLNIREWQKMQDAKGFFAKIKRILSMILLAERLPSRSQIWNFHMQKVCQWKKAAVCFFYGKSDWPHTEKVKTILTLAPFFSSFGSKIVGWMRSFMSEPTTFHMSKEVFSFICFLRLKFSWSHTIGTKTGWLSCKEVSSHLTPNFHREQI